MKALLGFLVVEIVDLVMTSAHASTIGQAGKRFAADFPNRQQCSTIPKKYLPHYRTL